MKIAIYSRKSKYTGKGESVENQIELCREYIRLHISDTAESDIFIYEDEGFSAKNLDRPQFQQMMTENEKAKFDYIIVYRLDRISRNVSDFSTLIEQLNAKQTAFVCIKEQFDTSTPMGRAMMYIASVFAQLERETIAERVRDNMMLLARTGRWLGGTTPTGFISEREETILIDGKSKTACKLHQNEQEIQTVKIMFEKFLELHSVNGVSKYLIKQGINSRTGTPYSLIGIKQILSNPVYCIADKAAYAYFMDKQSDVCFDEKECSSKFGLLSYNKRDYKIKSAPRQDESQWIIAIGKHKGIISGDDWVKVQEMLCENKPNSKAVKPHNVYSLLSGMIICQKCGARMFAKFRSRDKGKTNIYDYVCDNKLRGGMSCCDCKNLNGKETDDAVCEHLLDYMNENSSIYKNLEALKNKAGKTLTNNAELIDTKITKLKSEIDKLLSSLTQDVSDTLIKYVDSKVSELDSQCRALGQEKLQLESELSDFDETEIQLEYTAKVLANFKENFSALSLIEKRELMKLIIEKIEWDGENLDIFLFS